MLRPLFNSDLLIDPSSQTAYPSSNTQEDLVHNLLNIGHYKKLAEFIVLKTEEETSREDFIF